MQRLSLTDMFTILLGLKQENPICVNTVLKINRWIHKAYRWYVIENHWSRHDVSSEPIGPK